MFIPDPDFYPSRIPDLGFRIQKQQQNRGVEKKISSHTFLCSHKFHKIENYFSFEVLKKKVWANFQRIFKLFTPKIVTKLSKIWVWDPEKTYSGSRIQVSKRHLIPDPDPQHCRNQCLFYYFCLITEGIGSGRPKNIWILRIRNTV
jgi:hypothetical protein